ncbi:MAG: HD domain-containing protein [Polyangiales bacterium]
MLLRDPVHGLLAFDGPAGRVVERLLATREVQRLRNVRQLGLTSLVFPGAEHSRFTHSLGATHVMVRMLARMRAIEGALPAEQRVDAEAEADVIAAALLHDLGHGPFSHLFEEVVPHARRHEAWTVDIVLDPATDVHRALAGWSAQMPERVAALIEGHHRLGYLGRCISGTLDADRCDYLLRDSHMTGVGYGVYDLDWLLQAFAFGALPGDAGWVLAIEGRKGLPPIEGFFLSRQFMYQQVYHHKATRAAEALIRAIFIRAAELIRDGSADLQIPAALRRAAVGDTVPLGDYLALDDVQLLSAFQAWQHGSDRTLADLTGCLARRDLPKTLPLRPESTPEARAEALRRVSEVAQRHGLRPDLTVRLDTPYDVPYEEPDVLSPEGLWVLIRHQPIRRLGGCSFLLGQLRNQRIERPRLIFPASLRDEALAVLEGVID